MRNKVIAVFATVIIAGAWLEVYAVLHGGLGPSFDAVPHQAAGQVMAREALSLLRPAGQISVIVRDTSTFKNPASDAQLAAFRKITTHVRAAIRSIHLLQVDPLRPLQVPPGEFFDMIRNTPEGDVIVSFVGPPVLTPEQRARLGETRPAILAFCPGALPDAVDLRLLFDQGLLQAAVVDRRAASPSPSRSSNFPACFEKSFLLVTRTNLADLPTPLVTTSSFP